MQTEPDGKTALVVLAHPDPRSFNGCWARSTEQSLKSLGFNVLSSDLTRMGFDAVESSRHYSGFPDDRTFDPLKAQEQNSAAQSLPLDVKNEITKLEQADLLIFHSVSYTHLTLPTILLV